MPTPQDIEKLVVAYGREEYERGWQDALKEANARMVALQSGRRRTLAEDVIAALGPQQARENSARKSPGRPAKAKETVRRAIQENPGLSGIEIIRKIAESGETVAERTVRTNLRRLNFEGAIVKRNARWFPAQRTEENTVT